MTEETPRGLYDLRLRYPFDRDIFDGIEFKPVDGCPDILQAVLKWPTVELVLVIYTTTTVGHGGRMIRWTNLTGDTKIGRHGVDPELITAEWDYTDDKGLISKVITMFNEKLETNFIQL